MAANSYQLEGSGSPLVQLQLIELSARFLPTGVSLIHSHHQPLRGTLETLDPPSAALSHHPIRIRATGSRAGGELVVAHRVPRR